MFSGVFFTILIKNLPYFYFWSILDLMTLNMSHAALHTEIIFTKLELRQPVLS